MPCLASPRQSCHRVTVELLKPWENDITSNHVALTINKAIPSALVLRASTDALFHGRTRAAPPTADEAHEGAFAHHGTQRGQQTPS